MRQIRKLTEVSRALTNAESLDEVFRLTVGHAADLLDADQSLILLEREDGLLTIRSSHGVDVALRERFQSPFDEDLAPRLMAVLGAKEKRFLGVPIVVAGVIKGTLVVVHAPADSPPEMDEWLLSALADQAAVALQKTQLDQVAEFREQLIGIIGHDLRNPLSVIAMGAHLLLRSEGLGEKETELARRIALSVTQASELIEQLVDLTRSRLGGGIPIQRRRFHVMDDLCKQLIGETEMKHPDRPLRVQTRGAMDVEWDRDRMRQLLGNLLGNAVTHGEPRSPIELKVEGTEREVVIEIANRGRPIAPESLTVIFEAFRQGRAAGSSRSPGLGLGLFIAQQIARAHGGSISATSSESEGTTFRVRLPRTKPAPTP